MTLRGLDLASCADLAAFLASPEHHAPARVALYESLRHRALTFLSGAAVTPAADTGAALLGEAQALRVRAAALAPLLPGAVGVGEQALAALVSDESPVSSLCLLVDRAIRDVRAPRPPRHLYVSLLPP